MQHSLLKQSPKINGKLVPDSPFKNKFFKTKDEELGTPILKPYTYEIYVHIVEVYENHVVLNGVQFSSDGNVCFVNEFSYPILCINEMVKTTKVLYNKKVSLCGPMAKKILAK